MKNITKKSLCLLLAVVLCISSLSVTAFATPETPYENSRFYTEGDYEIHYRLVEHKGEYKGRIMMLHGFLCSTYAWRNMAEGLSAEGYDCYLADLPNFGYSTRETENTESIDRETLIIHLMQSIADGGDWVIAGHSMGGGVAVNIAEEFPVKAVLLYCPAPQSTCPAGFEKIVTAKPMKFLMNSFFKVGTKLTPVVRCVIYAATKNKEFSKAYDVTGVTAPFAYDGIGAGMCEMLVRVRPTDLDNVSRITAPVLLVEAEEDIIISADMKTRFYTAFPNAATYLVTGGGHQCIEDRAAELVPLTAAFLTAA